MGFLDFIQSNQITYVFLGFGFLAMLIITIAFTFSKRQLIYDYGTLYHAIGFNNFIFKKKEVHFKEFECLAIKKLVKRETSWINTGSIVNLLSNHNQYRISLKFKKNGQLIELMSLSTKESTQEAIDFLTKYTSLEFDQNKFTSL